MSHKPRRFEVDFLSDYTDGSLLAEIKRVAAAHGNTPLTAAEFERLSGRVSASTVRRRFGGWRNAMKLAGLDDLYGGPQVTKRMRVHPGKGLSDQQLLSEMRRVQALLGGEFLTKRAFDRHSTVHSETVSRRLGGWRNALRQAGVPESPIMVKGWTTEECFENIALVWERLGRRPRYDDMNRPPSTINSRAYETRWGTWRRALTAFITWANEDAPSGPREETLQPLSLRRGPPSPTPVDGDSAGRRVSLKVRFKVLQRDLFRCLMCGRSPATHPNLALHVDHVVAVALGGKSTEDNLQTLCETCNVGKGVSFIDRRPRKKTREPR